VTIPGMLSSTSFINSAASHFATSHDTKIGVVIRLFAIGAGWTHSKVLSNGCQHSNRGYWESLCLPIAKKFVFVLDASSDRKGRESWCSRHQLNVGLELGEFVAESVDKKDNEEVVGIHRAHIHYVCVKIADGNDSIVEVLGGVKTHFQYLFD
jgi:hypothetical protein